MIESCPFCKLVEKYLMEQGLEIPIRDISKDWEAYKDLKAIGGKIQAPCLIIDGEPLYESQDILTWLREHEAELSAYEKA